MDAGELLWRSLSVVSLQQEKGKLRVEDLDEDTSSGCRRRLSHDVLDVFFNRLLCNKERIRNLFICPPLCQMLYDGLFAIGELEFYASMLGIEVLPSPQFFHSDHKIGRAHVWTPVT